MELYEEYTVVDTIHVMIDGKEINVRYVGVDSPESSSNFKSIKNPARVDKVHPGG